MKRLNKEKVEKFIQKEGFRGTDLIHWFPSHVSQIIKYKGAKKTPENFEKFIKKEFEQKGYKVLRLDYKNKSPDFAIFYEYNAHKDLYFNSIVVECKTTNIVYRSENSVNNFLTQWCKKQKTQAINHLDLAIHSYYIMAIQFACGHIEFICVEPWKGYINSD